MNPFLTFQMLNASSYDCWNMRVNAAYENMIATGLTYHAWAAAPLTWCFSPYMSAPTGNAYLLDPAYTETQIFRQSGVPLFQYNNQGYGNYGGMGGYIGDGFQYSTQNQYSPYGPYVQAPSQNNSGKSSGNTEEDEKYKAKYEKLSSLMDALKTYANSEDCKLSDGDKAKIKAAIIDAKKSGKTPKEKFEILEKAYQAVVENNQEDLKEFIVNNDKMGIDGKSSGSDKSIKAELLKIGYEYENTDTDNSLSSLYEAINNIKDSDGEGATDSNLIGGVNANNILDIISSWNSHSEYKETRLMEFIVDKYNALPQNSNTKDTTKSNIIKPFVDALAKKAREELDKLDKDDSSKNELQKATEELEKSFNVMTNIQNKFDTLYKLTRVVAAKNLQEKIKNNGYVGDVIDVNSDTAVDLESEGYDISENNDEKNKEGGGLTRDKAKFESYTEEQAQEILKIYNSDNYEEEAVKKAWKTGKDFSKALINMQKNWYSLHWSTKKDYNNILDTIKNQIDEKDIFTVLAGYEDNDGLGNNLLTQIHSEYGMDVYDKNTCINKIIEYAIKNLEAQKIVAEDQYEINKIQNHINILEKYYKKSDEITSDKMNWTRKETKEIHKILDKYSDKVQDRIDTMWH